LVQTTTKPPEAKAATCGTPMPRVSLLTASSAPSFAPAALNSWARIAPSLTQVTTKPPPVSPVTSESLCDPGATASLLATNSAPTFDPSAAKIWARMSASPGVERSDQVTTKLPEASAPIDSACWFPEVVFALNADPTGAPAAL
jgi:hypothetical protein